MRNPLIAAGYKRPAVKTKYLDRLMRRKKSEKVDEWSLSPSIM